MAEVPADRLDGVGAAIRTELGTVTEAPVVTYSEDEDSLWTRCSAAWKGTLEKVFPSTAEQGSDPVESRSYQAKQIHVCKNKVARPTVFIPVFPGTNCEYDSAKAFERAGADVVTKVFRNLTAEDIRDSVDEFEKAISQAQIIMFPGGFSAGDEPDGSAKFFATAFQNAKIKEAVMKLLNERDGLCLGICNGFQALIKLGLVPFGEDRGTDGGFPDPDLQHHQPPHFQDGIHEGGYQQIALAGGRRAGKTYMHSGIPRRRTLRGKRRVDLTEAV